MTSTPAEQFIQWTNALDDAAAIQREMIGQRVRYVGLTGRADGPHGRITRVTRDGLRVRFEHVSGDQVVHPDDVVWLTEQ